MRRRLSRQGSVGGCRHRGCPDDCLVPCEFLAKSVGRFQPVYRAWPKWWDGGASRTIAGDESIRAGCSVRTLSGSKAAILLRDGSKLTLALARSCRLPMEGEVRPWELKAGAVDVEAARQQSGKKLVIRTPGSRITTLGTVFSVQLRHKS